jgi:hypothetical protein
MAPLADRDVERRIRRIEEAIKALVVYLVPDPAERAALRAQLDAASDEAAEEVQ